MEKTTKHGNHWLIKAAALFLCALLLMTGVAIFSNDVASALEEEQVDQVLIVSDSTVNRGAQFDVDISIAGNGYALGEGMHGMRLFVTYDTSALTLLTCTPKDPEGYNWSGSFTPKKKDILGGYTTYGTKEEPFVLYWDSTSDLCGNGVIATLTFASSKNSTVGEEAYKINVEVSKKDTVKTVGKVCEPQVSGGNVNMLLGVHGIVLLKPNGEILSQDDDNVEENVTISGTLAKLTDEEREAGLQKTDPYGRFTYTFIEDGWRDVSNNPLYAEYTDATHRYFAPSYSSSPIPYVLTFKQGIIPEGESEISYDDPFIQTLLGADYTYDTETVSVEYGKIVVFDTYKPANGVEYTFYGWYEDEDCTIPVSFVTMPVGNRTLYGVYKFNQDPDTVTTTKLKMDNVIDGDYVYATLSVTENFGFNTLHFVLDYDPDVLTFDGFLFSSEGTDLYDGSAFYSLLMPTFPDINATLAANGAAAGTWQQLESGYTLEGKSFYFESTSTNVYATGALITFRFVKNAMAAAGDSTVGVTINNGKDLTRYVADDTTWYANAVVTSDAVSVIRVEKPVALDHTYYYNGAYQIFLFDDGEEGYAAADTDYYTVANASRKDKKLYTDDEAVKVTLKSVAGAFVVWAEDGSNDVLSFDFEILKMQIAIPAEDDTGFVYNYNEQTYAVVSSSYYTVTGTTRTDAGSQDVTITLKDTANTCWTDGTIRVLVYDFVIAPKKITPPTATALTYTYDDGNPITYQFATAGSSTEYNVLYNTRTKAGVYDSTQEIDELDPLAQDYRAVKVSLKDAANTVWNIANATEEQEVAPLYFTFTIAKKGIAVPLPAEVTYKYNGEPQTFLFTANDTNYPAATTTYYTVSNQTRTNAGAYVSHVANDPLEGVKVALKDPANVEWNVDNATAEEKIAPLYYDFNIAKLTLASPDVGDDLLYTGATVKPTILLTGEEPYEVYENEGGVDVGTYPVVFAIKEENLVNYAWANPDDGHADRVTVTFNITLVANNWTVTPYVVGKVYDGNPIQISEAAAAFGEPVVTFSLGSTVLDGAPTDVGDYTLNVKVEATNDYGGLSKTINFSITPKLVTKPTATTKTYEYTGAPQTYEFANPSDTERYVVMIGGEEATAMTNAGTKLVTVALVDSHNYSWADGSNGVLEIGNFVIAKAKVVPPIETTKTYVYTGSSQSYEFGTVGDALRYEIVGVDDEADEDDNVQTRTRAGSQTVIVRLLDKNNTEWDIDAETEAEKIQDIEFLFTIQKKALTVPIPKAKTYIYSGKPQTFEFASSGDTERYTVWIGDEQTATKTEADFYVVRVTLNDPDNYMWVGNTVEDKTYSFVIRYASLTASTTGSSPFTVTAETAGGFAKTTTFGVIKADADIAALVSIVASSEKIGALSQMSKEEAAVLTEGKCVVASLALSVIPGEGEDLSDVEEYLCRVELPSARSGLVAVRLVDGKVEVFATDATSNTLSFTTDSVGAILVLAEHSFDKEVRAARYIKTPATCEGDAVYYKSCACGLSSNDDDLTFVAQGSALGHDYDLSDIRWIWGEGNATATARLVCSRDPDDLHYLDLPAEVEIYRQPPKVDESGFVIYTARVTIDGVIYSNSLPPIVIPETGHVYSTDPIWGEWEKGTTAYSIKATFVCDCGESVLVFDADVVATSESETSPNITLTAMVFFEGVRYVTTKTIDKPTVRFDFADGTDKQESWFVFPGNAIDYAGHPAVLTPTRDKYGFVGWQRVEEDPQTSEVTKGVMLVKGKDGSYPDYVIGFEDVNFIAVWRSYSDVNVSVRDTAGTPIAGAKVTLVASKEDVTFTGESGEAPTEIYFTTTDTGTVTFEKVPYGNYKIVVEYPYVDDAVITRSDALDVNESIVNVELVLPRNNFNTVVEGDGSSEGLENAITEEEKTAISDDTASGTINEIVITQKRIAEVSDDIKEEIITQLRRDDPAGKSEFTDFYSVTMIKTTTRRNSNGIQSVKTETITVAHDYQTNVFPLTAALKEKLVEVNGTANNIFVYKRHVYEETQVVLIYDLPKVSAKEGKDADYECYFIKEVAGLEYIAIRQREYSELAFGVSPDPILLANQITALTIEDWTFGDTASTPVFEARYGKGTELFTYSSSKEGPFTDAVPTDAGNYYLRAYVPATGDYAAAEKIVPFKIARKVVARPDACTTEFVYNGSEQTYVIAENAAYTVQGNKQTDAGKYDVTVSLVDPANTVWDSGLDDALTFAFEIKPKKLTDLGTVTFKGRSFWFNGKKHSIKISGDLPEGVTVLYEGNGESDLGKFVVTATFVSSNPNYDVSDPMRATMNIRLNWVPILILILLVLVILITVIVIVERMLNKLKKEQQAPPLEDKGPDGDNAAAEEGANND